MKCIERNNVKITDGFWKRKQELNRNTTIHAIWNRFYDTGRIDAFDFNWREGMDKKPRVSWDSDIAKWMEAAAYLIEQSPDSDLEAKVEGIIDKIEEHQCEDGYFNIFHTVCEPEERFKNRGWHELYCAGHLMEAAVAWYRVTGRDRFLKCMEKYADLIYKVFVEEQSANFVTPGHQEIELALIKMYHETNNKKYLDIAEFFIEQRGKNEKDEHICYGPTYAQSHLPARQQKTAVGHAVRACYWYSALADFAFGKGDKALLESCQSIFSDIVNKKMYITGGIGSTYIGEAFTTAYDLPNETAYNETCASIAMILFCKSMLKNENKSIYADIIEKEIYNGVLSALSVSGKEFFYENPLEINLRTQTRHSDELATKEERLPITQRKEVFDCSCCPPNISRLFAVINEYIYAQDGETLYVNQFMSSEADAMGVKIKQETSYPLNGKIKLSFENAKTVMIRIPMWCDEYTVDCEYDVCDGYIKLEKPEDVNIEFVMKPVLVKSSAKIFSNAGKVALQYGPVIYCGEAVDNIENLHSLYIDKNLKAKVEYCEEWGLNNISLKGFVLKEKESLYYTGDDEFEDTTINLIPYSTFANRGESNMLVWFNTK